MKKHFYYLVTILLSIPITLSAQEDLSKYLAGAVPEEDGKIVFKKEFNLPGVSEDAIYDCIHTWMDGRLKKNENNSRIVFTDKENGIVSGLGEEYIVFKAAALSLDRTIIQYQLNATCAPEKCMLEMERIRYTYEGDKFNAEEYISDNHALNKTQTKLVRGLSKFRIKTIDYVEDMFTSAQTALATNISGVAVAQPIVAKQTETTIATQPVVITQPIVTVQQQTAPQQAATVIPATSISTDNSLEGFRKISPDKIPGNIIKMLSEDWMLITAGNQENFNMMTASWGGLGMLFGKPVAFCFINPTRYTYQLMEKNDTYTFTFYTEAYRGALEYCGSASGKNEDKIKGSGLTPITTPEGSQAFSEAWLIIECRKLVSQSLMPEAISNEKIKEEWTGKQLHKMYAGEIINVWVK